MGVFISSKCTTSLAPYTRTLFGNRSSEFWSIFEIFIGKHSVYIERLLAERVKTLILLGGRWVLRSW